MCLFIVAPSDVGLETRKPCWCNHPIVADVAAHSQAGVTEMRRIAYGSSPAAAREKNGSPIYFRPPCTNTAPRIKTGPRIIGSRSRFIDRCLRRHIGSESRRATECSGSNARDEQLFHMTTPMDSAKPALLLWRVKVSAAEEHAKKNCSK